MKTQAALAEPREKVVSMNTPTTAQAVPTSGLPKIDPARAGLAIGALLGLFHLGWALLVAVGWAQPLMDFVFRVHFLTPPWSVEPFHFGLAVMLVLFTTAVGYLIGYVGAVLWNPLRR